MGFSRLFKTKKSSKYTHHEDPHPEMQKTSPIPTGSSSHKKSSHPLLSLQPILESSILSTSPTSTPTNSPSSSPTSMWGKSRAEFLDRFDVKKMQGFCARNRLPTLYEEMDMPDLSDYELDL